MERIFKDFRTIQRYKSGPFGLYVQQLAERLRQQGYTREQAHKHLYTADDFGRWLRRRHIALCDVTFCPRTAVSPCRPPVEETRRFSGSEAPF